jgi:hypothetical protein
VRGVIPAPVPCLDLRPEYGHHQSPAGDPLSRPLIEIARESRDRRATARDLVDAAIARHESVGERLHAYSFWAPEQARATVLHGWCAQTR